MNTTAHPGTDTSRAQLAPWLIVLAGLAFMYVPSFVDLFRGVWSTDQQAHGPIVFAISIWLLYRKWPGDACRERRQAQLGRRLAGAGFGLLLYILGRSQDILLFEIGSLLWVLVAIGLLLRGTAAVKAMWFPLFFMLFMIPLPGVVVDTVTMPMKMAVSYVAEHVLYWVGYPIARTGVILQIGQYQLLVADACAGLHTCLRSKRSASFISTWCVTNPWPATSPSPSSLCPSHSPPM